MPQEREPVISTSTQLNEIEDYIISAGGMSVAHPGGNLGSHLNRVAEILKRWNVEQIVINAGHLHAAYGTDGFGVSIASSSGREEIVKLVGKEAEELISLYCRCDRKASYPSWASLHPVVVDRGTKKPISIDETQRKALICITIANEIDVLNQDAELMREHGDSLAELFGHWRRWLTKPAVKDLDDWILARVQAD